MPPVSFQGLPLFGPHKPICCADPLLVAASSCSSSSTLLSRFRKVLFLTVDVVATAQNGNLMLASSAILYMDRVRLGGFDEPLEPQSRSRHGRLRWLPSTQSPRSSRYVLRKAVFSLPPNYTRMDLNVFFFQGVGLSLAPGYGYASTCKGDRKEKSC
jgi:hypothetical protein